MGGGANTFLFSFSSEEGDEQPTRHTTRSNKVGFMRLIISVRIEISQTVVGQVPDLPMVLLRLGLRPPEFRQRLLLWPYLVQRVAFEQLTVLHHIADRI